MAGDSTLTACLVVAATLLLARAQLPVPSPEGEACPPDSEILPCRCSLHDQDLQIWCSHSDLAKVLSGLRAVGSRVSRPVDELILESNSLPSLPGGVFSSLRVVRLMLRGNGLERVAASWLAGLEDSLLEIYLVEPLLRTLPADSLDQLNGLEAVTIQGGAIKRVPRFSGHPRLRYIHVQSPSLVELSAHGFRDLPDLEQLHVVRSPRLARLEAGLLHDLPRLRVLNVSECGVAWIHPRAFARLPSLTELVLSGNRVVDAGMVGRAVRDLSALAVLRLDHNLVERLAEGSFVDVRTLRDLHLQGNRITELHRGAFHLTPALRRLHLGHNRVRRAHPDFFLQHSDSGLEELWLEHNQLEHVSEVRALLDTLPRLRYLDLSFNLLREIAFGALHGHPTLEQLHLDHNRLHHVQREAFMAMPALRELRLRNNSLSAPGDGPMWNLPGLKGLDLSLNVFRRLEPRLLANLPSLRRLDLSGNGITLVDPDSFVDTPALEHVNLSGNALVSLHPATFHHLRGLYELDVGWNQLREVVPGLPRALEHLRMPRNQVTALPLPPSPDLELPALKLLDLSGNGLDRVPPGALSALSQLRSLALGENGVQQLEDGALQGLVSLEVLDLRDNRLLRAHGHSLRDARQLRELHLGGNRLETLQAELLRDAARLEVLDVSRNQLESVPPGALEASRLLERLDVSRNALTAFPDALHGLARLRSLDLSHNRLKHVTPAVLHSMAALSELRLANNKFRELREATFSHLPNLTLLDLDSNELQSVASRALHALPSLRAVRLSHNRLPALPEGAFHDLPQLLSAELQANQLANIAGNAFKEVPLLVMLNLSHNLLERLDHAGIQNLKSLEILDLSHNKMVRIGAASLVGMEGLVELKMDDNRICAVQGSPFAGMLRLRLLSLRNNRMAWLPEPAFRVVRASDADLRVAGNPLACSCGLQWLQAWLRETGDEGPRCADGQLLREARPARGDCTELERVAPGCEAVNRTQVAAPSPEESEYFYDEYVEYPLEENNSTGNHSEAAAAATEPAPRLEVTTPSGSAAHAHYVTGNTPTLYAGGARLNKTSPPAPSPQRGGLTFFGIPLPSINIGGLWGGPAGRAVDSRPGQVRFVGARGKVQVVPHMETGFVPMVPQTGGFTPIADPHLARAAQGSERRAQSNVTAELSGPVDVEPVSTGPGLEPRDEVDRLGVAKPPAPDEPPSGAATGPADKNDHLLIQQTTFTNQSYSVSVGRREPSTPEPTESLATPTPDTWGDNWVEPPTPSMAPEVETAASSTVPTSSVIGNLWGMISAGGGGGLSQSPSSLSALLVPGGQQPQFRTPGGKPTITKVVMSPPPAPSAPPVPMEEYLRRSQPEAPPRSNETTDWYYRDYNRTDLPPYVGPGKRAVKNRAVTIALCATLVPVWLLAVATL